MLGSHRSNTAMVDDFLKFRGGLQTLPRLQAGQASKINRQYSRDGGEFVRSRRLEGSDRLIWLLAIHCRQRVHLWDGYIVQKRVVRKAAAQVFDNGPGAHIISG